MPSAKSGAFGSAKLLYGAVRDIGGAAEQRPMLLCGR